MAEGGVAGVEEPTSQWECGSCGISGKLRVCGGCRSIYYCSKDHQVAHWKIHKKVCKHIQTKRQTEAVSHDSSSAPLHGGDTLNTNKRNSMNGIQGTSATDLLARIQLDTENSGNGGTNTAKASNAEKQPRKSPKRNTSKSEGSPYKSVKDAMATHKVTDQSQRHPAEANEAKSLPEYVIKCLTNYGLCVVDDFLGEERGLKILAEVQAFQNAGILKDGQTVSKAEADKQVRCDQITWVEKGDASCTEIGAMLTTLDTLLMKCNGLLARYNINGRTKAMVACYPGNGTYYMRHVDNPNEDGRCITCIYYLNKDWDVVKHGGLLRIYPTMFRKVADVEPCLDRLLFFWSDRRNPHEVQPAYRVRYAITVWYFDAEERLRARKRYKDGKENYERTLSTELVQS